MSILKEHGIGTVTMNREKQLRKEILERYENVGRKVKDGKVIREGKSWLKGLKGGVKTNVAILYENTAKMLMETESSSSGSYENMAFPIVRRVFSKLLANEIVSVQALTTPESSIFFYYPQIGDRVEGVDGDGRETQSHTSMHAKNLSECVVGGNCDDTTFENCKSLYDRFYNDDLYDYSKGKYTVITASGAPIALDDNGCWTTAETYQLAFDQTLREIKFGVTGFDGDNPGTNPGHTARLKGKGGKGLEIDTEEFLTSFVALNAGADIVDNNGTVLFAQGAELFWRPVGQKYGSSLVEWADYCSANGTFYISLDLTKPLKGCPDCPAYDGYTGAASGTTFAPADIVFAWRKYDDLEYSNEIGEVTFTIKKQPVSVVPRKLRARWTPELAQDVAAYHNIDAEAELTALLSEQIAMEIDREILRDLKRGANWRLRWDFQGWKTQGSQKYTEKEWKQTLITKINQVSAQIHKSTLRGGASFIVVSTEVSALFDDLENFMVSNNNVDDDTFNLGMKRIGTLSGRFTVYVDPYSRANDVLVGYKGNSILDSGYIYCPYVPAQLTQTIVDFNNFTNVKGIQTRYGKKLVNGNYYGFVFVDRIPTFDTRELR